MTARASRPGSPPTADLIVRSRSRLGKRKDSGGPAYRDQVALVELAAAAVALRVAAPRSPAVIDAASFLAIVGFRRGLGFALQGKAPDPSSAAAVLRGYRLGQRLLSQPLVDWQPTHPRFRRRRHF